MDFGIEDFTPTPATKNREPLNGSSGVKELEYLPETQTALQVSLTSSNTFNIKNRGSRFVHAASGHPEIHVTMPRLCPTEPIASFEKRTTSRGNPVEGGLSFCIAPSCISCSHYPALSL